MPEQIDQLENAAGFEDQQAQPQHGVPSAVALGPMQKRDQAQPDQLRKKQPHSGSEKHIRQVVGVAIRILECPKKERAENQQETHDHWNRQIAIRYSPSAIRHPLSAIRHPPSAIR
ncbi:MAG: hypothetical protein ACLGXA_18200 [Acidobacteriota bacterium]